MVTQSHLCCNSIAGCMVLSSVLTVHSPRPRGPGMEYGHLTGALLEPSNLSGMRPAMHSPTLIPQRVRVPILWNSILYPVCSDLRMAKCREKKANQCTVRPQWGLSQGQRYAVETDIHHCHINAKDLRGKRSSQPPTLPLLCKASQPAGYSKKGEFPLAGEVLVASSVH